MQAIQFLEFMGGSNLPQDSTRDRGCHRTLITVSLTRVTATPLGAGGSVGRVGETSEQAHGDENWKLKEGSDILLERQDLPNSSVKSVTLHSVPLPAEFSAKI